MRKLIFIPILFFSLICSGATYYVKTGGNDGNTGLSDAQAWLTVNKVNTVWAAGTFNAGDSILFNRGNTFSGYGLIPYEDGTLANPIVIGAYGTGVKPVISGFATLSSWTNEGGGIYSASLHCGFTLNNVTYDGTQKAVGRFPDSGWYVIDSHVTNTTLTATELTGAPMWDNAEVIIRKNRWTIDRSVITDHTGTTITYTSGSSYNAADGWGFFIQRDLEAVTALGEWYHDDTADKLYMYFGAVVPGDHAIQASTVNYIVYNSGYDYIIIDSLTLTGGNAALVYNEYTNYCDVKWCNLTYGGAYGIYGKTDRYGEYNLDTINYCFDQAIYKDDNSYTTTVDSCTVTNIGLIAGMGQSTGAHYGGIGVAGNNNSVTYCKVENIGYNGINFYGTNDVINYNFVNNFCTIKDDGGGIYTYIGTRSATTNKTVSYNIVLNGIGNIGGTTSTTDYQAHGIYLDDNAEDVDVNHNSIANMGKYGIFMHNNADCNIEHNIVFNANNRVLAFSRDASDGFVVENNVIKKNIFFAKSASAYALSFGHNEVDYSAYISSIDSNFYCRPIDEDYMFVTSLSGTPIERLFAGWKTYISDDAASELSPISIADTSDIDFYYNYSNAPFVQALAVPMIDLDTVKYAANYTIPAWGSVVLLEDPAPVPPDQPIVTTTIITSGGVNIKTGGGNVTGDGGGTISARGVCWNTTGSPTISDSKTTNGTGTGVFTSTLTGILPSTTYYVRAYATNESATGYGVQVTFVTGHIIGSGAKYMFSGDKIIDIR